MKPKIQQKYIDTGKVRLQWHNFAWINSDSKRAAEASACAHAQGKFWPYHDKLYQVQQKSGAFSEQNLTTYATELGLDQGAFADCLKKKIYAQVVADEFSAARKEGFTGTPTFLVNGKKIVGLRTFEQWVELIEATLKEKGA